MSAEDAVAAIRHQVTVDAPPSDAFAGFTEGINSWWPRDYTWSRDVLERIAIEPWPGGLCQEFGSGGMRLDWGRVTAWEPPRRLAFSWHVGPDRVPQVNPAHASQVEVRFDLAHDERTLVSVEHDGWERHGPDGRRYREQFDAARAWPSMLDAYASVVERRHDAPWSALST